MANTVTNTYDLMARRLVESVDLSGNGLLNTKRQFVYGCASLWEVIEQIDLLNNDNVLLTHVFGLGIDDEVSYRIEDPATPEDFWTHRDDLGSVTSLTDINGAVVERYEYGDYGDVRIFDAAGVALAASSYNIHHLYTGRTVIPGTGLMDYRYRVYSPGTGRFVQRDPLGYIDGMNLYQYTLSSPLGFVDSYGLSVAASPPFFDPTDPRNFGRKPGQSFAPKKINWKKFIKNRVKGSGLATLFATGGCAAAILELDIACRVYFKYGSENWARCLCAQLADPPRGAKFLCQFASKRMFDPIAAASDAAGCDILNSQSKGGCR